MNRAGDWGMPRLVWLEGRKTRLSKKEDIGSIWGSLMSPEREVFWSLQFREIVLAAKWRMGGGDQIGGASSCEEAVARILAEG